MAAKKKKPIEIIKKEDVEPEILAQAIVDVADAAKKLLNSKLTKRAVLVLIKDKTNIPMQTIESVLDAAANLKDYVR